MKNRLAITMLAAISCVSMAFAAPAVAPQVPPAASAPAAAPAATPQSAPPGPGQKIINDTGYTVIMGDPTKAQPIVTSVCAACHGADGNSVTPTYPKLAGQIYEYLLKQLNDFKSGKRQNAIMSGMVASLSEDDMRNLAAYFSEQKIKPGAAQNKGLAVEGEKIWRAGVAGQGVPACQACHGPTGQGIPIEFPHLASQHADYVYAQLVAFRSGARANDPGKMMRTIASRLSDQDMKALAQYINGLH